ncbi:hypothetical protein [Phenylobacterium sp.]|uniref:PIN-like domain-containing protein n=1 Tax=Phenylobacterium sp. TaxID=1871053 RepID=UPI002E304832|nr:hypothetical protein [Phenylobacterium sp.]HEX3367625.1 hypothetical protein [Phenylobacterium sp.]
MAELTFFFDRCFGTGLPKWLKGIKTPFDIEFHDDKKHGFKDETPDDEWLAAVGKRKWVVLSHDKRFHKDSMAMEAVKQHKVACFYVDGGSLTSWGKLVLFCRCYIRIRTIVKETKAPYIYRVTHRGTVILVKGGW